ncbi:MAG: adenosyl-hopene transferase HpnH, partial [Thermoguttaceae bacterium]|nr:adenosyl-hopene transferase HpnH [Thermoguttaceae bacterium]
MRFPFSLVLSMSRYIAHKKWSGQKRFPLVLMLEPSHRCNLRCQGCGRIREYQSTLGLSLTVQQCLDAVEECGAPTVSICGGEPLLYEGLQELLVGILQVPSRHVYLCTNGLLLQERLDPLCSTLTKQMKKRLFINVHLDGPASIHDKFAGKSGLFEQAMAGLSAAKKAGLAVYTNTTVYRQTTLELLIELGEALRKVPIDGMMISPAFGFESVDDSEQRIFMTQDEIKSFFHNLRRRMKRYRLTA